MSLFLWIAGVILALPQGAIPLFQLLTDRDTGNALLAALLLPADLRVAGCAASLVLGLATIAAARSLDRKRKRTGDRA